MYRQPRAFPGSANLTTVAVSLLAATDVLHFRVHRSLGIFLRRFPHLLERVDVVALLDEWAARFFEELDYVREGNNGTRFAASMAKDLPQVCLLCLLSMHQLWRFVLLSAMNQRCTPFIVPLHLCWAPSVALCS